MRSHFFFLRASCGRCQITQISTWCGALSWLGLSVSQVQVADRLAGAYFWASSGELSTSVYPPSQLCYLVTPALRTDRALVLKAIYLSSWPPATQVGSRRACSFLPACLSLKDDPRTCLPVSATHNKWGMNRQLHLRGGKWIQKGRKGEIQANLVPIVKSHVDTVQTLIYLYIYMAAYAKCECITLS